MKVVVLVALVFGLVIMGFEANAQGYHQDFIDVN
jgi:hypothetical protein